MSTPRSIISNGYVALDVIRHDDSIQQSVGGTAANVAANLAHLGWRSRLVGRVGKDPQARRIVSELSSAGVSTDLLVRDPDIGTPVVVHKVQPPKHSFEFKCPDCGRASPRFHALTLGQIDGITSGLDPVVDADVVFVDRASPFSADLLAGGSERGALTVFEPSSRGTESASREAAEHARILKWSEETKARLHRSTLALRGNQLQIETRGERGLRYRIGKKKWDSLPAPEIETLDSAGAGDWLTTGLLDALPSLNLASLDEDTLVGTLRSAQAMAALSCRYIGARTLTRLSAAEIRRAEKRVLRSNDSDSPRVPVGRRSRASGVCALCLTSQ